MIDVRRWLVMAVLSVSGGMIFLAPFLREVYYIPMQEAMNLSNTQMGMLMGVNACPPFLLSLTYVFTLQSVAKGIAYFFMFFIGTTVYFVPMFFLGYLNRIREFQFVGRISAMIVGLIFLGYSIYGLFKLQG